MEIDPKKKTIDFEPYSVLGTRTGQHCMFPSWRYSDMNEFGEGIVLYFMFLKWLAFQFLVLTLLSIPAFSFFYRSNSAGIESTTDFTTYIYMFTLGTLGEDYITCDSVDLSLEDVEEGNSVASLYCPYGVMESIVEFGLVME
jgi:hypothetical protein